MGRKWNIPRGWGLPLGALIAAALGHAEAPAQLLVAHCGMSVATLGLPDALRQGCAELISKRRVLGSALIAIALSALLSAAALLSLGYRLFEPLSETYMWIAIAGVAVCARCAGELFAADRKMWLAQAIEIALCAATLFWTAWGVRDRAIASDAPVYAAGGLAAVAAASIPGVIGGRPQADFRFMKHIPAALVRVMLFPAMAVTLILLRAAFGLMTTAPLEIVAIAAGMLVMELGRSTFRRSREESAGFLVSMTALGAVFGIVGALTSLIPAAAVHSALTETPWMLVLSAGCGLALYANGGLRTVLAILLLMLAPFLPALWSFMPAVKAALTIAAALLMIPEWKDLLRGMRANRIRRKARR